MTGAVDNWVSDPNHAAELAQLTDEQLRKYTAAYPVMSPSQIEGFANVAVRGQVKKLLQLPTLEEFSVRYKQDRSGSHETDSSASQQPSATQPG